MSELPVNGGKPATVGDLAALELRLKEWMIDNLVARSFCQERHRFIDPRQIWKSATIAALVTTIVTGVVVAAVVAVVA